jgi:hypothetical protein
MKTRSVLIILVLISALGLTATFAQSKRNRAAKEFMRQKLELSQRVLEGIVVEDYNLVATKAGKLGAMTRQVDWRLFENPEYDQQSQTFRRHVDSLVQAAQAKSLEASTLAYVRMTMSCVDCHKAVRGRLIALRGDPSRFAITPPVRMMPN